MELWVSLCIAGDWDQIAFKGPFQLKPFIAVPLAALLVLVFLFFIVEALILHGDREAVSLPQKQGKGVKGVFP